jgi:hypothetical protein
LLTVGGNLTKRTQGLEVPVQSLPSATTTTILALGDIYLQSHQTTEHPRICFTLSVAEATS